MSTAQPAQTRRAYELQPIWKSTKQRIRRMAGEQGHDPETLALQAFNTSLDNLLEWQAREIESPLDAVERARVLALGEASGEMGYCFECGIKVGATSVQCGGCKEGIPQTGARVNLSKHLRPPSSMKRGKFITYD